MGMDTGISLASDTPGQVSIMAQAQTSLLTELAARCRYEMLKSTNRAGSGHPTSGLSATELMIGLLFGGRFRYDVNQPEHPNNDRLIFSKGHATPLLYALWAAAGQLTEDDLMTYRQFGSDLEGHPSVAFPYVDAATGSLGQGLSIGVGMALNARYLDKLPYRTYVLLGDSEMAEGSNWESIEVAAHYQLDNLVGILDVNRLGQRGETMYGHDLEAHQRRISAFGWKTILIDGHQFDAVLDAYEEAAKSDGQPVMIIARTIKGKGVSFLEDQNGWHGKALDDDDLKRALDELGEVNREVRGRIAEPEDVELQRPAGAAAERCSYDKGDKVPTRNAYGNALKRIFPRFPSIVSLDGEVSNSTRAARFKEAYPDRFFEMYIAEQNMVGAAVGLSCRGQIPFVSSFAAFLTRAADQIRMSQYSEANIKFVGSHAGVSIGQDGPSQMGLEDLAMFRSILDSVVLYPCDAVSTEKLVEQAAAHDGIVYLRTTRGSTPVIYDADEEFPIGGSKVLRRSEKDEVAVVAAGITVHEALAAHEALSNDGVAIRVIDLYSVKPVDAHTLREAARDIGALITVEDHFAEGGLADAVRSALSDEPVPVHSLAVRRKPRSGQPQELLDYERISHGAIIDAVKKIASGSRHDRQISHNVEVG
jgi:transketolase